jgi:hypothetical protein
MIIRYYQLELSYLFFSIIHLSMSRYQSERERIRVIQNEKGIVQPYSELKKVSHFMTRIQTKRFKS